MPPWEVCLLNLLLLYIYLSQANLVFSLINYSSLLWWITYLLPSLKLPVHVFHCLLFSLILFQNIEDHVAFVITVPTALAIFLAVFVLVCIESIFKKLLRVFSLVIWACLVAMGYLFMFSGGIICPWDQVRHVDVLWLIILLQRTMWYILWFVWCFCPDSLGNCRRDSVA